MLAFVPGIALQVPAAAATRPSPEAAASFAPARPLPCTLGLGPALQLQAGLLLPTGQTTHTGPLPTARPLPDSQARLRVARDLRCGGHTVHRIPPTACSLRRSGLTREMSELATASGQTRIPTAHHHPGGVGQTFTCDGTQAFPTQETSSVPAGCDRQVPGMPGSQTESLIVSCGPLVSPRIQFSSECAAFS